MIQALPRLVYGLSAYYAQEAVMNSSATPNNFRPAKMGSMILLHTTVIQITEC
jgi:hypothetical protein